MAHFAKISKVQNIDGSYDVIGCYYGRDEDENNEEQLSERTGDTYKRTSYNTRANVHLNGGTPFRKNYGGKGSLYWPQYDGFSARQPFPSWTLNTTTLVWECPVGHPDIITDNSIGTSHSWNEDLQRWEAFDLDGNISSIWNTTNNTWEQV